MTEIFSQSRLQEIDDYITKLADKLSDIHEASVRIFYVEDSRSTASYFISLLQEHLNAAIDHFVTAEEALIAYEEGDYDLVLAVYEAKDTGRNRVISAFVLKS